jgi:hypothetical protein
MTKPEPRRRGVFVDSRGSLAMHARALMACRALARGEGDVVAELAEEVALRNRACS